MELKLSQAIRLGAMLKPQGVGMWKTSDGKTCALGAAADALSILNTPNSWTKLREIYPILGNPLPTAGSGPKIDCPACGNIQLCVGSAIAHLNDDRRHLWTREQIADWVESLEKQSEIASPESVEQGVTG